MYIFDYCFHNSLLDCVYEELEIPLIIILMQILFDRTAVVFTIESIQHFSQFIAGDSYYLYATISKEIFCIISNDQILHIKKIPRSPGYPTANNQNMSEIFRSLQKPTGSSKAGFSTI